MNKLWDETSDFADDDDRLLREEAEECAKEMELQRCRHQRSTNGSGH